MTELSPQATGAPDISSDRLKEIHGSWTREQKRTPRTFWGPDSALGNARSSALLLALFLGVLAIQPDSVLWTDASDTTISFIHFVDGWRLAAVVVLLSMLNGLLLDLALTDRIGKPLRPLARVLRFLTCSVPPLGLVAPALWYRLSKGPKPWLAEPVEARSLLPATRRWAAARERFQSFLEKRVTPLGRRLLAFEWTFYWILISNLILPFAVIYWLSNPAEMTDGRYAAAVAASAAIHSTAFAGAAYFFASLRREQTARWSRLLIAALPFFWLVPLPLFFFLGFIPMLFVRGSRGDGTLADAARDESDEYWRKLIQSLTERRPQMTPGDRFKHGDLEPAFPPTLEQKRLLWFYKGKSTLLLFDAIAVTGALASLRERVPAIGLAEWLLGAAAAGALALGGAALVAHLAVAVSRPFRSGRGRLRALDDHPWVFYLGVTQLVFFTGCLIGVSLQRGSGEPIAGVLVAAGMLGMLAELAKSVLPIPQRIRQPPAELVLWMVLFFSLSVTGLSIMREPEQMAAWMALLRATAPLYALMGVVLSSLFAGWLLHPHNRRHLLERKIPGRRRRLLAMLTVTAVMPLGGLFVPLWIYARYRWPAEVPARRS